MTSQQNQSGGLLLVQRNEFDGQRLLRRLRLLAMTENEVIASAAKQSLRGVSRCTPHH